MFEDRSKSGYDFKKFDSQARTKVIIEDKQKNDNKNVSIAHQKLFGEIKKPTQDEIKHEFKTQIIKHNTNTSSLSELPSSAYLKQFENQIATLPDDDVSIEEKTIEQKSEVDFNKLIESSNSVKISSTATKEINNVIPKPKKNFSFRIKLVTGVYCILVALFGGWVISNTINISNTNASLYETTTKTKEINNNILEIVSDIKQLDNASSNPEDETIVVKIITEEIDITPEAITEPNQYEAQSNWFDVACDWISGIFGG